MIPTDAMSGARQNSQSRAMPWLINRRNSLPCTVLNSPDKGRAINGLNKDNYIHKQNNNSFDKNKNSKLLFQKVTMEIVKIRKYFEISNKFT